MIESIGKRTMNALKMQTINWREIVLLSIDAAIIEEMLVIVWIGRAIKWQPTNRTLYTLYPIYIPIGLDKIVIQ